MQHEAFQRIEFIRPGRSLQDAHGVPVACLPAVAYAGFAEIDVLAVVLAIQRRCQ